MARDGKESPTHVVVPGDTALIISVPHAGTAIPEELAARLTPLALTLPDTDWHVAELYDFAPALGATLLIAQYSRYLIDLNRPPDDAALYSAAPKTGLCPTASFAGEPLYLAGDAALDATEIAQRREQYWQPYHDALHTLLAQTRERFGYALLLDAHSIRSEVPRLFEGRLPDINVGTNQGSACTPALTEALRARLSGQTRWSRVFDGRFTGGYITRYYGRPAFGVHAVQIELAQSAYMDETGTGYEPVRAAPLRDMLGGMVASLLSLSLPLTSPSPGRP
jgi:N-formylglutamate deformylase